jgi:hypothetical protein
MIGRAPMMLPPQYVAGPVQSFPGPQPGQAQPPRQWLPPRVQPAQQPPPAQLAQAKPSAAPAQQPVQPIVARGMRPDDPPVPQVRPMTNNIAKPGPLTLPSPEELGVAPRPPTQTTPAAKVDWNAAHDSLQRLGGTGFQLAQLADGRYRVGFVLRTDQADQVHHIEATAATQADAVASALARAEQWAGSSGR